MFNRKEDKECGYEIVFIIRKRKRLVQAYFTHGSGGYEVILKGTGLEQRNYCEPPVYPANTLKVACNFL